MFRGQFIKNTAATLAFFILFMIVAPQITPAQTQLIVNGGFETGNFSGWTATNAVGSFEDWQVTGSGAGFVDSPVPVATQVVQGNFNAWNTVAANAGGTYTLVQQVTIPTLNTATLYWRHRYQMNLTTYCNGSCGSATYAVEILNTSNVLLQTLYTITTPSNANTNTGWTQNTANLTPYAGLTIRIRFRTTVTATLNGPGRIEIDDVRLGARPLTSSEVNLSGTVKTASGEGISRASVTIMDSVGTTISNAMTNSFGMFKVDGLEAGNTYTVIIGHRKYQFNPQIVTINEDVSNAEFVALE